MRNAEYIPRRITIKPLVRRGIYKLVIFAKLSARSVRAHYSATIVVTVTTILLLQSVHASS